MKLLSRKVPLAFALLACPTILFAQNPSSSIATWKNDAQGAYTLVHDDYGDVGVDGIWQYADTIAYNRGIKFTFGAITERCETARNINGYANPYDYAKNVMMAQHGHEIMNHSHTHDCAVGNAGWSPCDLPVGQSWGEDVNGANFTTQLVTSHNSIVNNTSFTPKYYIFPYDRFSNAANVKLKELNYLGSRTGWTSPLGESYPTNGYDGNDDANFAPDNDGFFRTAVSVFDDVNANMSENDQVTFLKSELDAAISANQWINRELHNVGTSGWGYVKINAYRRHLNYVKSLMDNGTLWTTTVSEILTYQLQKLKFNPQTAYNGTDQITVSFTNKNAAINVNTGTILDGLTVKSPVTIVVDLDGVSGTWTVTQNGATISDVTQKNGKLYINAYPHVGSLVIQKNNGNSNSNPYVASAIPDQNLSVNFATYQIDLMSVFQDAETADGALIYTVSGSSNVQVNIANGIATISSTNNWTGSETITFEVEDEGGLKVTDVVAFNVVGLGNQTAYNGPHNIPGKIEAEDFDDGADGEAYHEVSTNYEPVASSNPYRSNHDVDVQAIAGGMAIGYTETGEWLEYTVNVAKTGDYDFNFRTSQEQNQWSPLGELRVLLDNNIVINSIPSVYTASWTTYTTINVNKVFLTAGTHILRVEFVSGSVNFDYFETTLTNEAPIVENPLSTFSLDSDFTAFNIDLMNVFEDAETTDGNLIFSASGNSNIQISITNGVASVSVAQGWTGTEVVTFKTTDEGGLTKEHIVAFVVNLPTGINVVNQDAFRVYPNPTNGRLYISGKVNFVQVFGPQGNVILQTNESELDLSRFAAGVYLVRVNNSNSMFRVIKTK